MYVYRYVGIWVCGDVACIMHTVTSMLKEKPTHRNFNVLVRAVGPYVFRIGTLVVLGDRPIPERQKDVRLVVAKNIMPKGKGLGKVYRQK